MRYDGARRAIGSLAFVSLLSVAGIASPAMARQDAEAPTYTVYEIDILDEEDDVSNAYGVNDDGTAVGDSMSMNDYITQAIVYSDEVVDALPVENPDFGSAGSAINSDGAIVGFVAGENGTAHAVLWVDDELVDLGTLGGDSSYALDINDEGQIVGWSASQPGTFDQRAVLWDGQEIIDLGALGEGGRSVAYAINEEGVIVGYSTAGPDGDEPAPMLAVIWEEGELTELPSLGGADAMAYDVNDDGVVVGASTTGEGEFFYGVGTHAVIWEDGEATDLETLEDGERSSAEAINSDGVIVGMSAVEPGESTGEEGENHATIWIDGEIFDLNELIPADSEWVLEWAYDINDEGVIVGSGWLDGERRGFMLVPDED